MMNQLTHKQNCMYAFSIACIAIILALVSGTALAAGGATFELIGKAVALDKLKSSFGISAMSGSGTTVAGQLQMSDGSPAAFRSVVNKTGKSDLTILGNLSSGEMMIEAAAVSSDGNTVVGPGISPSGSRAFRWTLAGGLMDLGVLPGYSMSNASDVSADGSIVVGYSYDSATSSAFRWVAGQGMQDMGAGSATAVSRDGAAVVGLYGTGDMFLWSIAGGMQQLGVQAQGTAVTSDASVIVGGWSGGAFRWSAAEGLIPLGSIPEQPGCGVGCNYSYWATDVSEDGEVVVGISLGSFTEPFLWTRAGGMRLLKGILMNDYGLNLNGYELWSAYAVSADGSTIVGDGINSANQRITWRAVIPR